MVELKAATAIALVLAAIAIPIVGHRLRQYRMGNAATSSRQPNASYNGNRYLN
jgi:Tfp pilus assembly major pilin PilA